MRDTCWKLHGYPPGHPKHKASRFNKSGSRQHYNKPAQPSANYIKEGPMMEEKHLVMNGLSDLQFQKILSIMNNTGNAQTTVPQANVAVTTPGLLQTPVIMPSRLILDSGATDHITSSLNLLVDSRQNTILPPVIMPSGEQAPIMSTGTLHLNYVISLKNVLGVPSFKVDLMSISQITRGLNCSVTFFPYWCVLQDLATKTTIGLGRRRLVWVNNEADFITWLH